MENYSQQRSFRRLRESNNLRIAILGSGLAAYIAHQLIPNSVIITKKPSEVFLGNVFVHDRIETRLMLKILGVRSFRSQVVPFYYYDNLTEIIHNEISEADRMTIIREKMGKLGPSGDGDISISTKVNLDDEFRHLVFDVDELKNNLRSSAIEYVLDFTKITEHDRGVDIEFTNPENVITFDGVINTIPRYAFDELAGHRKSIYAHEPVTFVNTKNPFKSILDPDYMVYTFNKAVFKRVLCKNGQAAIEYNASVDELPMVIESLAIDFPDVVDYTTVTIPYGRIISQKFEDTPRIIHVGRFAEWNHIISMEHVINKICLLNL